MEYEEITDLIAVNIMEYVKADPEEGWNEDSSLYWMPHNPNMPETFNPLDYDDDCMVGWNRFVDLDIIEEIIWTFTRGDENPHSIRVTTNLPDIEPLFISGKESRAVMCKCMAVFAKDVAKDYLLKLMKA